MTKKLFPSESAIIPISKIDENPQNPRAEIGDTSDLEASIQAHGLLQPITVRPVGNRYEVVAGSRRFAALKKLGFKSAKCEVRKMSDKVAFEIATTENVSRRDMTAADECNAVAKMLEDGTDIHSIAAHFGRSPRWAMARFKMHQLGDKAMDMLREGHITLGHAEALIMAPDTEIEKFLERSWHISPDQLREEILAEKQNLATAAFDAKKICKNCEKQTIKQQDIFGDISESYCLDGECFRKNLNKKIEQIRQDFLGQGFIEVDDDVRDFDYYSYTWVDVESEGVSYNADTKLAVDWLRKNKKHPYFRIYPDASYKFKWNLDEYRQRDRGNEPDEDEAEELERRITAKAESLADEDEEYMVKEKIRALMRTCDEEIKAIILDLLEEEFEITEVDADGNETTDYESWLEHYKEDRGDEHLNFDQEVIEQLFNHYHSRWHRNRSRKFFGLGDTAEWQSRVEKNMKKAKKIVEEQDKENAEDED